MVSRCWRYSVVGHDLGLSDVSLPEVLSKDGQYVMAHPTIRGAVMNYDKDGSESDCSPHPMDIMAIQALYQTVP